MLIENRLVRTLVNDRYSPLLPFPVEGGHIALYRVVSDYALDEGVDKEDGSTYLIRALRESNNLDEAISLIQSGVDVNLQDENGITALMIASKDGHSHIVRALLALHNDINIDLRSIDHTTALHFASMFRNYDIAKALIEAGADVNNVSTLDVNGLSILERSILSSVVFHENIEFVELLIEAGADVNYTNNRGDSILMICCHNNKDTKCIKALIEAGADVNIQNVYGETPLIRVCKTRKLHMIEALIESGRINMNLKDEFDRDVIQIAVEYGYIDIVEKLSSLRLLFYL